MVPLYDSSSSSRDSETPFCDDKVSFAKRAMKNAATLLVAKTAELIYIANKITNSKTIFYRARTESQALNLG